MVAGSITSNSTTEGGSGGGISNEAELVLENVTISGNNAGSGGGILAQGGNAKLTNVTLYSNSASGAGGGINSNGTALTMNNSILAGNRAEFGPNCGSGVRSAGHNLLGDLTRVKPPSCDEAAGRFLGLSFAGWNVVAALILTAIAFKGAFGKAR